MDMVVDIRHLKFGQLCKDKLEESNLNHFFSLLVGLHHYKLDPARLIDNCRGFFIWLISLFLPENYQFLPPNDFYSREYSNTGTIADV